MTESAVSAEQAQSRNSEVAPVVTAGAPLSCLVCLWRSCPPLRCCLRRRWSEVEPAAAADRQTGRREDGSSLPAGAPASLGCEAVITPGSDNYNRGVEGWGGDGMRTRSRARAHQEPRVRSRT